MSFHIPATHRRTPAARTATAAAAAAGAAAAAVMVEPEVEDEFDDSPMLSLEAMGLSAASLAAIGGAPQSTTTTTTAAAAAAVPVAAAPLQPAAAPTQPPSSPPPPAEEDTLTLRAEIIHRWVCGLFAKASHGLATSLDMRFQVKQDPQRARERAKTHWKICHVSLFSRAKGPCLRTVIRERSKFPRHNIDQG